MINNMEKSYFDGLLNRGGYVLDFTTSSFDKFTFESIGVGLCEKYCLSKGKSLNAFMDEGSNEKIVKLLSDFLDYYEVYFQEEISSTEKSYRGMPFSELYKKCKSIILREKEIVTSNICREIVEDVKEKFSSEYLKNQIDLMMKMCDESPTDAIGKSKELIESCCKSILSRLGEFEGNTLKTSQLVKRTMNTLNIPDNTLYYDKEEEDTTKKIIGSLNGLSSSVNELRNQYGTGHGKSEKFKSLSRRHANLSVGASAVLVQYLWDTYLYKARMKK